MEDSEGVLSFDFEGGLDAAPTNPAAAAAASSSSLPLIPSDSSAPPPLSNSLPGSLGPTLAPEPLGAPTANVGTRRSFRQTVCRHWLRSLCMKGDACGFLHQYDKSRMPICRFFRLYGECREQDCVYKHTNEDIKECNMYKFGFCPNGPDCRYRHAKLPGPPPSVEEILQKIQHLGSYNYGSSNKFFSQRGVGLPQQNEKSQFPQGPAPVTQGVIGKPSTAESANVQQQQVQQPAQQTSQTQIQSVSNGQPNQLNRTATSLPQGISRYFIVKSCNRENLELSVQQGVWATQRSNEAKLNEAFDSADNVILIFSVNRTRHFQGCAKMMSRIGGSVSGGNWKYAHGTAHYGQNFSLKWLKLCELSFQKTRHLRNPYNENLPVKISRDCQELEPSIGEQLASLLYLEPDGELMAVSIAAESKREEEKAKGVNPDIGNENPDIVPFEDNEEEEEEESEEEEEESFGQSVGLPAQGRGRGRGIMWPPHMPMGRGARPFHGMQSFPPGMMGPDGLSYGPVTPDGFPMPDIFGMAPRGFGPYGPRFSGDFMGPPSAMMFRGRPSQPGAMFTPGGFGMMMGQGRGPFMGGMGVTGTSPARPGRPVGVSPLYPPPAVPSAQNINRAIKRDQRGPTSDRNDRYIVGPDQNKGQEMLSSGHDEGMQYKQGSKAYPDEQYGMGTTFRNEESESEDEAPRRSRHGEGKKKRRGSEGDATAISDQ
ncbi:30-kDa cleavage and polyadenylation specificity factor 30 [Cucumis melo var. makuwa]|uniref:30-kDa cleavage and polyadenylation specificity factor 30 n=1 Tax=Cucumis melo var. makuwa TaxID=1194695 RepID=A0A5D3C2W1_CUCMM|nr:30-kDa cleavage and polyadenylation specificity factor 30 [Cucumis melo var. makuwa]TYK05548.1 30-kDa cleavage and polyadenylation specificity factor 30 [Cucumis melo var. makuwa]